MIWFKKMPSTKSMYMVRLSWLPLPNGPKVFTCEREEADRKAGKVTPQARSESSPGPRLAGPVWADGGHPTPTQASVGTKPTLLQASLPVALQATDARQQEENFPASFPQRPRREKKNKGAFQ